MTVTISIALHFDVSDLEALAAAAAKATTESPEDWARLRADDPIGSDLKELLLAGLWSMEGASCLELGDSQTAVCGEP